MNIEKAKEMKPTEEQIKKFWEKIATAVERYNNDRHRHYYFGNDILGKYIREDWSEDEPPIDLNNLFKYAVPKLYSCSLSLQDLYPSLSQETHWCAGVSLGENNLTTEAYHKDPSLALFWAIWKVIEEASSGD